MSEQQRQSEFKNTVAGGFGGMCVVLSGQPFDTVKVRLQAQPADKPIYRGAWDCVRQTVTKEGVRGLYKGMGAPLVGVVPIFAVSFFWFWSGEEAAAERWRGAGSVGASSCGSC